MGSSAVAEAMADEGQWAVVNSEWRFAIAVAVGREPGVSPTRAEKNQEGDCKLTVGGNAVGN